MKLPFKVDLSKKVVAVTGAGGVICGEFARALAACGAKVALLDINFDAAKKIADEIGDNAIAVRCDCLNKDSIIAAKKNIEPEGNDGQRDDDRRHAGGKRFLQARRERH